MKNNIIFIIFSVTIFQLNAQTANCDGTLPFEEKDGLLTIEMESVVLPANSNWKTGSEADPNLSGSTINYIYWDGAQSFSSLSGAEITYNIKINNPGTYRLAWRGRIGAGDSRGEHNDAWLKIVADDFYATQSNSPTASNALEPKPSCTSNPNRNCPEGSTTGGFFKAFMNRSPTGDVSQRWGFVTNTNDGNSFRFIWATFNTAGNYSIIVDARSNFFFMDKMVLRKSNLSDSFAFNLNNTESNCYDASLSVDKKKIKTIEVFPNPSKDKIRINNLSHSTKLILTNTLGAVLKKIDVNEKSSLIIDISNLESGVYFISSNDRNVSFSKKIIKI